MQTISRIRKTRKATLDEEEEPILVIIANDKYFRRLREDEDVKPVQRTQNAH
ncbi:hypothetical protein RP20_CCG014551 [Aedes albopictus]|nr:hypothetical protein RP20_CCG014551 [Aedes albopictus]